MKKLKSNWIKKDSNSRIYNIPVPIIGLTGGIATGKSTVANLLRNKNIPVIDADQLVKNIYQQPSTIAFIRSQFPESMTDQKINFKKLREIAFANEANKSILENYIYSYLPEEFKKNYHLFESPPFIVYDVPLLFEKKLHLMVDLSICVYAPKTIQIERLMVRDQISRDLAESIINQQMDIEDKKKMSDFTISNTGAPKDLEVIVERLLAEISE